MTTPSTLTSRNLRVDEAVVISRLPVGWPLDSIVSLRVDPPASVFPGKDYRVDMDLDAGTATITEVTA